MVALVLANAMRREVRRRFAGRDAGQPRGLPGARGRAGTALGMISRLTPSDDRRRPAQSPPGPIVLVGSERRREDGRGTPARRAPRRGPSWTSTRKSSASPGSRSPTYSPAGRAGLSRPRGPGDAFGMRVDSRTVVSTGGGWMARPELRETWPDAVRVWLRVEPGSAVSRLARDRSTRPLLAGPDPENATRRLLVRQAARLPAGRDRGAYGRAGTRGRSGAPYWTDSLHAG